MLCRIPGFHLVISTSEPGFPVLLFILVTECSEDQVLIPAVSYRHTEVPTYPGLFPRGDLELNA